MLKNVEKLNDMRPGARLDLRVTATVTDKTTASIYSQRSYWKSRGIRFEQVRMANQADAAIESNGLSSRYAPSKLCAVPFWRMYIIWNGDTVLCCCDSSRTVVPGNVMKSSIGSVWRSDAYKKSYIRPAGPGKICRRSAAIAKYRCPRERAGCRCSAAFCAAESLSH